KLDVGLISDVTSIEMEGDDVIFTRPIYSGKAYEKKKKLDDVVFITIRPNNIEALDKDGSRSGEIEKISANITDLRTIVQEVVRKASDGVDLSEAKVVVAGGRGVKSAEGFEPLKE